MRYGTTMHNLRMHVEALGEHFLLNGTFSYPSWLLATFHMSNSDGWETVSPKKRKSNSFRASSPSEPAFLQAMTRETVVAGDMVTMYDDDPTMILLVGYPGSGKSTWSHKLLNLRPLDFVRVNQDELKNRQNCINKAETALRQKKSVIIDRVRHSSHEKLPPVIYACIRPRSFSSFAQCHASVSQREYFLDLAQKYRVLIDCVHLEIPESICLERIRRRGSHPTLKLQDAPRVIGFMQTEYQTPRESEGFRRIWTIRTEEDFVESLSHYAQH